MIWKFILESILKNCFSLIHSTITLFLPKTVSHIVNEFVAITRKSFQHWFMSSGVQELHQIPVSKKRMQDVNVDIEMNR